MYEYTWTRVQAFRPSPIREKYREIWNKIRMDTIRLDQICAVHRGLWTGALHIFIVDRDKIDFYQMETDPLKPALRGKDIKPFGYIWREFYVIYAAREFFPDFDDRFPNIMKWLERHRLVLERRSAVFTWGRKWWELEDPLHPAVFETPKILSPLFARFQSFALDVSGTYYVLDSSIIIRRWTNYREQRLYVENWKRVNEPHIDVDKFIGEGDETWKNLGSGTDALWYILALLNSEVLEFFFKMYTPRLTKRSRHPKKGRWYSYMPPHLNILPIKVAELNTIRDITRRSKEIHDKTMTYLRLSEGDAEKTYMGADIEFMKTELNEIIFDIYDLNEKEKIIIQNFVYRKR